MMTKFSIVGTATTDCQILANIFKSILPNSDEVRLKIRIVGEEINYNASDLTLYIFSLNQKHLFDDNIDNYQVECNVYKSEKEGMAFLLQLAKQLEKAKVAFVFDYCMADENGQCIEEEKSISSLNL